MTMGFTEKERLEIIDLAHSISKVCDKHNSGLVLTALKAVTMTVSSQVMAEMTEEVKERGR
jgi:hypothetical protein